MKTFLVSSSCLFLLLFSGCTLWNEMGSSSDEQLLTAAGFQLRPVQTAQQAAVMNSIEPYQVTMRSDGSRVYYIYADPRQNTVYVGGPQQYQKYQQLSVQQGIAEDQMVAASEMQMLSDEDSMWGPFW
jgi:hypothetical protein